MAASIKYRSIYYNTNKESIEWKIEICDTQVSGQIINFRSTKPKLNYEGLTQDIRPGGIYPTNLSFGFYCHDSAVNYFGNTVGPNSGFIDDLFESNEGRFIVNAYQDGVFVFSGVILPDQCSFTDEDTPILSIKAADGLYKLQTEDYVPKVGYIKYKTLTRIHPHNGSEFTSDLVTTSSGGEVLVGTEWIAVEHISERHTFLGINKDSYRTTTYARFEQYATLSPGTTWVDQGNGLWASEVSYGGEIIVDESHLYHLTRDVEATRRRILSEFILDVMSVIPTREEYGEVCMWDIVNNWYEHLMTDFTSDPYTMTRWSEKKYVGKKLSDVAESILLHFNSRLYYSNGRYHWEQLSERGEETINRHCYDYLGNFLETETAENLDLVYDGDVINTGSSGSYKFLAPLKKVEVRIKLDSSNLLENEEWNLSKLGQRYLGRIKMTEDDTRLLISINNSFITSFDGELLNGLSNSDRRDSTELIAYAVFKVWIKNITTNTIYYLTPSGTITPAGYPEFKTWGTDPVTGTYGIHMFIAGVPPNSPLNLTGANYKFQFLTDELPGDIDDSFDITISVTYAVDFKNAIGDFWTVTNPTKYHHDFHSYDENLTTVDIDSKPVNANLEKVYTTPNNVDNSKSGDYTASFCDSGFGDDGIEILSPSVTGFWRRSTVWSRNGSEGGVELLQLLAKEIMSLRLVPLRIYSGEFLTCLMTVQNRIQYGTYFYLPLGVSIDTDVDSISGEFLNIARTAPPDADVTLVPDEGNDIIGTTGGDIGTNEPPQLYFETDAVITAASTLTTVAIVNTLGVHIGTGEVVKIVNPETGVSENVTLTADINPSDVSMSFVSYTFINGFPDASLIILLAEEYGPGFFGLPYKYQNTSYILAYHQFPTYYQFPDPEANSPVVIDNKIKIWRNGNRMHYKVAASGYNEWSIDYATRRALFPIAFAAAGDGESIQIDAI